MNYIDIILVIAFGAGAISGLWKGLVREVGGLAALLFAGIGARMFAPTLLPFWEHTVHLSPQWAYFWSWGLTFLLLAVGINVLAWLITRTLDLIALGGVNKLLGAIFGGLKYILLFSVVFNLISLLDRYVPMPGAQGRQESLLYEPVRKMAGWSVDFLKVQHEHLSNKSTQKTV